MNGSELFKVTTKKKKIIEHQPCFMGENFIYVYLQFFIDFEDFFFHSLSNRREGERERERERKKRVAFALLVHLS